MSEIRTVGVLGAGTMGNGIAHVFARSGFAVRLCEVEQRFLDRGLETIRKNLGREVGKGQDDAAMRWTLRWGGFAGTLDRSDLAECDLVVEAATENFEVKRQLFRELDGIHARRYSGVEYFVDLDHEAGCADATARSGDRDALLQPRPVMKLVEVIRGLETSQETYETVKALAERLGKTPVEVNDAPGFVSNRVLMPLLNEAMFAVMEGVATADAVDEVFRLGMAHPMGPLTLADFIGLDVCLDIMRVLHDGLGDPKYRPCPLLVRMVDAGWLGRKSGRGFYTY